MLRRLIPTTLFIAQLLFCASPAPAQSFMPSNSSCPCTLQGSVVDSASNQPVPRALVRLTAPSPRATLTDSEGKFQFENLPAGSVTLQAEKPGFLGNNRLGFWSGDASTFQLGPDTPPAILKLIREGIIFGQVTDENGEPLEGFIVNLSTHGDRPSFGIIPDVSNRPVITNDQGQFRIAGIAPGSHYLSVRPPQTSSSTRAGNSSIPTGYSSVFYPNASDSASAVPVRVSPGKSSQANFSLKREPFIRLSGSISGVNSQDQVSLTLLSALGAGQNSAISSEVSFDASTSSFHTKWIPPGTYTLIAHSVASAQDGSRMTSSGVLRIDAASSHSDLRLVLHSTVAVPIVMHLPASENSQGLESLPIFMGLVSKEYSPANFYVPAANPEGASDGSPAVFTGVAPGKYELVISTLHGASLYPESATWGSTDLLNDNLVIDSSGSVPPIEITLRNDAATLNGSVHSSGPLFGTEVVLIAEKRRSSRIVTVAPNGSFEAPALAPGVYRVFAVERSANVDLDDPASLARISPRIQEITLSPKQSASINLELTTAEE